MANPTPDAATGTAEPRASLSLGTRFFIATAILVVLAIGAAVGITSLFGNQVGKNAAQKTLARSSSIQEKFQSADFAQLVAAADRLAGDPNFSAYIAESLDANDAESALDQLIERRDALGFDFAILLDPAGQLLVRTDDPTAQGEDFSEDLLFQVAEENYEAIGLWVTRGRLYQAAAVPVATGPLLQGYLVVAYAIDDRTALELRELNDTEISFLTDTGNGLETVAKTLSPGANDELLAFLAANPQVLEASDSFEVELQRVQWLAQVRPLFAVDDERLGSVVTLVSLDVQLEPFRRIVRILLAVGLIAMLLALVVSFFLPKRVLQPMQQLARVARKASEGDYDQEITVTHRDEVGQLATAFSQLLSELREKRDMEIYVAELARNVPDSTAAVTEAQPAKLREAVLLGLELRRYVRSLASENPRQALDHLTRDFRRFGHMIQSQGGTTEALLGHRLVASFAGDRQAERALSAAAEIIAYCQSTDGLQNAAIALVAGPAITGTITWDNQPQVGLTGTTVENLEGLLRVATEGNLLLSRSAYQLVADNLNQAGAEAQEYRSTVSPEPLYSLRADITARFTTPDLSATKELNTAFATSGLNTTLSGIGPGSVLGERFEILSELGAGGMGVVYKAHDRTLNELVALKMLKGAMWGDEQLERLKEELRLARKISHPNILRTFDFGDASGHPFISMEYVRGITLKQLLERSGRLPLSAGLRTARQLCRGLMAAHNEGILHRDIKPENLIIEPNGNVKLMDFGIARPVQPGNRASQTEPGALVGTPFYLAPEQVEGEEPDQRADLYACGVVLYEIFTGQLPFSIKGNIFDIIARKLNEDPTPPKQYWPSMPDDLERIILCCMERNREQRYGDVATLLRELEILRA